MMKRKLIAIGEALIDFIPGKSGVGIKKVESFAPKVGGAPANVCGAFSKLGGDSMMLTKLGKDAFGDKIIEELSGHGIDVSNILRTTEANTALAFVSLAEDGNREFSFYHNPSADLLLKPEEIKAEWFKESFALHFCSVDLVPSSMKEAHKKTIDLASKCGALISFDPNIRFPLWESKEALRDTILEFIPKANILKISDEELEFITGYKTIEDAKDILFADGVKLVLFTKGGDGAEAYTLTQKVNVPSNKVKAVDTTGAGDGFIGAFLYKLMESGIDINNISDLSRDNLIEYLRFANRFCEHSVLVEGAIASYPDHHQMMKYMK